MLHWFNLKLQMVGLVAYRLKTNGTQACHMRRFAGACRFVFNQASALRKSRYEAGDKKLGYAELRSELLLLKNSNAWFNEAPSQTLQQSLKDLECAYKHFFAKRTDFPRFKKKGLSSSFRFPQGCKLDQSNNRIFLPKLGWIQYRNSREVLGEIKNVTVSHACGQWYVSIQTEREVADSIHTSTSAISVDVGIAQFATLSDGHVFAAVNKL